MATYVPNAFDATQPTEEKSVESAALEFRTVKVELIKIDTVYGGMAAVTTVANDLNEPVSEIETVATNIANVNAVGTDIANVNAVAGNAANINTVAGNLGPINAAALQPLVQTFSGTGAQVEFTLAEAPGDENNTQIFISGVYQQKSQYSLAGAVIAFSSAPPAGTNNIEVVSSKVYAVGGFTQAGIGAVTTTVQNKLRESASLEDFGASPTSTPTQNAAAFIAAVLSGLRITPALRAYTFQFDGLPITYAGSVLDIDLGPHKHTFLNFGGIVADNLAVLKYNGRFSASNGYCKGLGRFRNLLICGIDTIEITNVFCDTPTADTQFFGVEYSSSVYGDNQFSMTVKSAVFKNIVTKTGTFVSGLSVPMTGFGNYGSSSIQAQKHQIEFGNLYVENFYSVGTDGTTILDGDGDFFRLFTNPTKLTIGNCTLLNINKRFIKTQEQADVVVENLHVKLDARFTPANFIGLFEGQATPETSAKTRFFINAGSVDFSDSPSTAPGPLFFNASSLDHEMHVGDLDYKNIGVYSKSQNIAFHAKNIKGWGLNVTAVASSNVKINGITDSLFSGCVSLDAEIDGFDLSPITRTSAFPITNATLKNGVFNNLNTDTRVAQVKAIDRVTLNYTAGASARRPFQPVGGLSVLVNGLTVNSFGTVTQSFDSPGGSGSMTIRDYKSTGQQLAYFGSGAWSFVLDNCADDTVFGAGVVSVTRAIYGGAILTTTASLAFSSIAAGSIAEISVSIPGINTSNSMAAASPIANLANGLGWSARVNGTDSVAVRVTNSSAEALTPATVTWRVVAIKF